MSRTRIGSRGSAHDRHVTGDGDELVDPVHLHGPVAEKRDDEAVGEGALGGQGIGHGRAHRRERARQVGDHRAAHRDVAGVPVGDRAHIDGQQGVVGQPRRQLAEEQLGVQWLSRLGRPPLGLLRPAGHRGLDAASPGGAVTVDEKGQQGSQGLCGVSADVHLGGVAVAEVAAVDVHLHRPGLSGRGEELGVRLVRADHEQRVALVHERDAGRRAEVADRARDVGEVVWDDALAEEGVADPGVEPVGHGEHLGGSRSRPLPDEQRDPGAGVQDLGGGGQGRFGRHDTRRIPADRRADDGVLPLELGHLELLHVVGQDHAGRRPGRFRGADGAVDHEVELFGRAHRLEERAAHVLEEGAGVDLLLVAAAEGAAVLVRHQRHHGPLVELGVVQAVQEVDGSRAVRGDAAAGPSRPLGVGGRHERGGLLVAGRDQLRLTPGPADGGQDGIDPVARVAEDPADAPGPESGDELVGDQAGHRPRGQIGAPRAHSFLSSGSRSLAAQSKKSSWASPPIWTTATWVKPASTNAFTASTWASTSGPHGIC